MSDSQQEAIQASGTADQKHPGRPRTDALQTYKDRCRLAEPASKNPVGKTMRAGTLLFCFTILAIAAASTEDDDMRNTMARRMAEVRKFFEKDELGMKIKELGKTLTEVMWTIRQQMRAGLRVYLRKLLNEP